MVRHRMPTRFHVQVFDRSQICRRFTSSRPRTGDRSKYRISFDWLRRCFTCRPYTGSSSKTTTKLRPPSAISFNDMECLTLTSTVSELFTRGFDQQLMNVFFLLAAAPMPEKYKTRKPMPRGVSNRNAAMDWIRRHATSGVVYFADDDNTYDVRLFEEMRHTRKISMWPVGLVTKTALSSPVVDGRGRVVDFFDGWISKRKFPVDMAGFALSVQLINEVPVLLTLPRSLSSSLNMLRWFRDSSGTLIKKTTRDRERKHEHLCFPFQSDVSLEDRCLHALPSGIWGGRIPAAVWHFARRYRAASRPLHQGKVRRMRTGEMES